MLEIKKGNIFQTTCEALVNPVNCMGVMGKGLAYEFRLRYPDLYQEYKKQCEKNQIQIGKLWIYKAKDGKVIVNFPTKYHWKYPSKIEYLEKGLKNFVEIYKQEGITSIAFPVLGSENGKIPLQVALNVMKMYLQNLDLKIEIYIFDKDYPDDLLPIFKSKFESIGKQELSKGLGLKQNSIYKIRETLKNAKNINNIIDQTGINRQKFERLFRFIMQRSEGNTLLSPEKEKLPL